MGNRNHSRSKDSDWIGLMDDPAVYITPARYAAPLRVYESSSMGAKSTRTLERQTMKTKAEALNLKRSSKWLSGLRPTKEAGRNPKDELGDLKVPLDLLSGPAQVLQAMCMDDGNIKYG